MKMKNGLRAIVVAVSCISVTVPSLVHAAQPFNSPALQSVVRDIALHEGGVLRGAVFTSQGAPQGNAEIAMFRDGQLVAETQTDDEGRFAIQGLTPGVYQVQAAQYAGVYRLWAANTAPPAAEPGLAFIGDDDTIRGQKKHSSAALNVLRSPWFWGIAVTTAIVLPLALDKKPGS